jgi:hypothetical protein
MKEIKTLVSLTFTDEVTGAVRTEKVSNFNVTHAYLFKRSNHANKLRVMSEEYPDDCPVFKELGKGGKLQSSVLTLLNPPRNSADADEWWVERSFRFNSTGSPFDIRTIILQYNNDVRGYVVLPTANTQGPSEVVDITYRVIYKLDMTDFATRFYGLANISVSTMLKLTPNLGKSTVNHAHIGEHTRDFAYTGVSNTSKTADNASIAASGWGTSTSLSETDSAGKVISYLHHNGGGTDKDEYANNNKAFEIPTPLFSPDNKHTTYPLGGLMNRGVGRTGWCEDLYNLATGLGYPSVAQTTPVWETSYNADLYHINIIETGNVGVATYVYATSCAAGGVNPDKIETGLIPMAIRSFSSNTAVPSLEQAMIPHKEMVTCKNNPLTAKVSVAGTWYNSDTLITLDNNPHAGTGLVGTLGIGVHNLVTDLYKHFDADTAPGITYTAMPAFVSASVCRNDAGSIFIAHPGEGITVINDPMGSPSISSISDATIGNTSDVIGLQHGYQGRIWFISQVEIGYTDDDGLTWVVYPPFTLGGTAGSGMNADDISGLVVSPVAHEIAVTFLKITSKIYGKAGWYDTGTHVITRLDPVLTRSINPTVIACTNSGSWLSYSDYSTTCKHGYAKFGLLESEWVTGFASSASRSTSDNIPSGPVIDAFGNEVHVTLAYESIKGKYRNLFLPDKVRVGCLYSEFKHGTTPSNGRYDLLDGLPLNGNFANAGIYDTRAYSLVLTKLVYANASTVRMNITEAQRDNTLGYEVKGYDEEVATSYSVYRQNASNAWVKNYNAPAVATTDGSSTADAIRKNFITNSNEFYGRCYLDTTASLAGVDFSTGGLTIAATYTPIAKQVQAGFETDSTYTHFEEPSSTCFELRDTVNNRSIVLMYLTNSQEMQFFDVNGGTATATVLNTGPTLQLSRIVCTLSADGTTVNIYDNNTQLGTNITLGTAFAMDNSASTLQLTMGCKNWSHELSKVYYFNVFKGTIENIQVWNDVWDTTDVSTDNAAPAGLITTATNLVSRYLLDSTTADYGEAKVTHSAQVATPQGLEIAFNDGDLSNPSYVANEAYSVPSRKYGYLKDNVTTMDLKAVLNGVTSNSEGVVNDWDGNTTVPGTPVETTQEILCEPPTLGDTAPGAIYSGTTNIWGCQTTLGSAEMEFTSIGVGTRCYMGLMTVPSDDWVIGIKTPSTCAPKLSIYTNAGTHLSEFTVPTPTPTDRYKITYDAVTAEGKVFFYNTTTLIWDQIGTTATVPAPAEAFTVYTRRVLACTGYQGGVFSDVTFKHVPQARVMRMGDKTLKTCSWVKDSFGISLIGNLPVEVYLDGTPATVITTTGTDTSISEALAHLSTYDVVILGVTGMMIINDAHAGKVVTTNNQFADTAGNTFP